MSPTSRADRAAHCRSPAAARRKASRCRPSRAGCAAERLGAAPDQHHLQASLAQRQNDDVDGEEGALEYRRGVPEAVTGARRPWLTLATRHRIAFLFRVMLIGSLP